MKIVTRDCYIVNNDDVAYAARRWLWFNTEEISCEAWDIMTISNELMVEVNLTNVIMYDVGLEGWKK